jgi:hypothetical protein
LSSDVLKVCNTPFVDCIWTTVVLYTQTGVNKLLVNFTVNFGF